MKNPFMTCFLFAVFFCFIFTDGLAQEATSEKAAEEVVEEDDPSKGILWTSEEGDTFIDYDLDRPNVFRLKARDIETWLGGRFVLEGIKYSHANRRDSGLELDDARLYIRGAYQDFSYWIEPDLVGVDTPRNLYEAWGAYTGSPGFKLTAGQMRVALGSEFATREEDLPVVGYGFTSYLDGKYDVGLRASGNLFHGILWYEGTAVGGHGFGLEGHRRGNDQYSLRLVWHPFEGYGPQRPGWRNYLDGFFLGGAVAYSPDYDEPIILTTPFESVVFRTVDLDGDKARWIHLEGGWAIGPVRLGYEQVDGRIANIPIGGGLDQSMDQFTAWSAYASWNLTGEKQLWSDGGWRAAHIYGRDEEVRGGLFKNRWELAARYSNADIDRDLFVYGLTSYDPSTQEVRTFSLDLNWYPMNHTRLVLGWVKTIADHELTTFGGTNRDSSFVLRMDLAF